MARDHGRPLGREVVRRVFKVIGMRRYSHWEEGWPHLSLDRPPPGREGAVLWRRRAVATLLHPADFAREAGEEVVIFGSGPSIRGQAAERVPPEAALLLNGAISLAPRFGRPFAAAIVDERFVWPRIDMIRAHLPAARLLLLSPAVMRAILSQEPALLSGRRILLVDNLLRPWRGAKRRLADLPPEERRRLRLGGPEAPDAAISLDPAIGVASGGTVALAALQFALQARPARIGLAGIDLSDADGRRFYEERDPQPSSVSRRLGRSLPAFALVRDEAAARGIALECYAPGSALLSIGIPYLPRLEAPWEAPLEAPRAAAAQATTTRVPTPTLS